MAKAMQVGTPHSWQFVLGSFLKISIPDSGIAFLAFLSVPVACRAQVTSSNHNKVAVVGRTNPPWRSVRRFLHYSNFAGHAVALRLRSGHALSGLRAEITSSVRPEPVEGQNGMPARSWFDKLTTNGKDSNNKNASNH
jgi:hypothetical protein